jgi:hypothetical protein
MSIFFNFYLPILFTVCCLFVLVFAREYSLKISAIKDLKIKASLNVKECLELATADQLLYELRKRKNMPFILLIPIKEKDYNGITIESHNVTPVSCLAILHLAKAISIQSFKKNGEEVPKLPPLDGYFE